MNLIICRIKVNYQVVDPAVEAAQARLDAMRTGRYVAPKPRKKIVKKEDSEERVSGKINLNFKQTTVKPVYDDYSEYKQLAVLWTGDSLMQIKSIAESSHRSFLQNF